MTTPRTGPLAASDEILNRAEAAARAFKEFDRPRVDRIVRAVAEAGHRNSRRLAEATARETGFGVVEDKVVKNEVASMGWLREYGDLDFVSHRTDQHKNVLLTPHPAGVIFALTPSTSPVANLYFKVLSALLTRNAIIISPHPGALKTSLEAAQILSQAATEAGAPQNAIQILDDPSVPMIEEIMADERVRLILATGGGAVVRAAYRSGTPAIGVGPGNAPVIVDETADLALAAERIMESKSYDNSVLCTAESVLIVIDSVAQQLLDQMKRRGAHLCTPSEVKRIRDFVYPGGKFNTKVVGRPASEIAKQAGVHVPASTKVLLTPIDRIHDDEPLTHEKLSPVLAVHIVTNFADALSGAVAVVNIVGAGHSAAIYSEDAQRVLDFSVEMPVHRVVVNVGSSLGNAGVGTGLATTFSIGTGFIGGSSLGENLSPEHMVHWKRTAYLLDASLPDFDGLRPSREDGAASGDILNLPDGALREELRRLIVEELRGLVGQSRG